MSELPEWRCHKIVRGAKIVSMSANVLCLEGMDQPLRVTEMYLNRHNPEVGGYVVQYEDGYQSYSPAKAFENGYSPVPAAHPVPRASP